MSDTDWYLLDRGGRRYGPYDRELVEQLAARDELRVGTPVWHPGLARWQPAESVLRLRLPRSEVIAPPAAPPSVPAQTVARPAQPKPSNPKTSKRPSAARDSAPRALRVPSRPAAIAAAPAAVGVPAALKIPATPMTPPQGVRRVVAALFDLLCLALVFRLLGLLSLPSGAAGVASGPAALFLLVWAVADASATVRSGSTPGQALMGIRVTGADDAPLSWPKALLRSGALPLLLLLVVLKTGFTIFIAVAALILTARRLRAGFAPWWDDIAGARVAYREPTPSRNVLAVLAFVVVLIVLGALLRR